MGRISKSNLTEDAAIAFFYGFVSTDTREAHFSVKQYQHLVDQEYAYKVRKNLAGVADGNSSARGGPSDGYLPPRFAQNGKSRLLIRLKGRERRKKGGN